MGKRLSDYVHMYNPYYIITMHIIKSQNRGGGGGGGGGGGQSLRWTPYWKMVKMVNNMIFLCTSLTLSLLEDGLIPEMIECKITLREPQDQTLPKTVT